MEDGSNTKEKVGRTSVKLWKWGVFLHEGRGCLFLSGKGPIAQTRQASRAMRQGEKQKAERHGYKTAWRPPPDAAATSKPFTHC